MAEIIYDQSPPAKKDLGFKSVYETRVLKEAILHKQFKILSIMQAGDLTTEFAQSFKNIARKMYDVNTSKEEVLSIGQLLDSIILNYSKM